MKRRSLNLMLSFLLIFSVLTVNTGAADFTDMPEDWSTEALERAVSNGLLEGDGGRIRADEKLTRAQMATVISRAFKLEEEVGLEEFVDVNPGDWFYPEMSKLVAIGSLRGDGYKLHPNNPITRQEAFVVIARSLNLEGERDEPEGLTDLEDLAPWARPGVYSLIDAGYVRGSNGRLNPQGEITRAEFAQLMDNLQEEIEDTEAIEKEELLVEELTIYNGGARVVLTRPIEYGEEIEMGINILNIDGEILENRKDEALKLDPTTKGTSVLEYTFEEIANKTSKDRYVAVYARITKDGKFYFVKYSDNGFLLKAN